MLYQPNAEITSATLAYADYLGPVYRVNATTKKPQHTAGFIPSRDPKVIIEWWGERPDSGIGLLTGEGVIVVDVDRHGPTDGFATLRDCALDLPATLTASTPRGGEHRFYRAPSLPTRPGIIPGIDLLATGGRVVLPPQPGRQWLDKREPVEVPKWIIEAAGQPKTSIRTEIKKEDGPLMADGRELPRSLYFEVLRLVPLSDRVRRHHQRRVIGILNIAVKRQRYRNDGLNIAAFCVRELVRDGVVLRSAAEQLLLGAATINGYVAKDRIEAAQRTIQSGLGSH